MQQPAVERLERMRQLLAKGRCNHPSNFTLHGNWRDHGLLTKHQAVVLVVPQVDVAIVVEYQAAYKPFLRVGLGNYRNGEIHFMCIGP